MKKINWKIWFGLILVLISAILFNVHFFIFKDLHHIEIYTLHDLAFLPLEVLLVTLILHGFLEKSEKKGMLKKMNMVIGTFFSEAGNTILAWYGKLDKNSIKNEEFFKFDVKTSRKELQKKSLFFRGYKPDIEVTEELLEEMKVYLIAKKPFFLQLLQNPNLLEHESFTDMLWALFHLADELEHRNTFDFSRKKDIIHLEGDIKRVFQQLLPQWMLYLAHLKKEYPYLFSLAARNNPCFAEKTDVYVD